MIHMNKTISLLFDITTENPQGTEIIIIKLGSHLIINY